MYKISYCVPVSHLEKTKQALFKAGAGHQGDYDHCCWQTLGQGQFKPLAGSAPFLGEQNKLHQVPEYKVEMICAGGCVKTAVEALKIAHPYDEPAIDVYRLEDA